MAETASETVAAVMAELAAAEEPALRAVRTAIAEVAEHRGHDVVALSEALAEMPDR